MDWFLYDNAASLLKELNKDISEQLVILFNQSFSSGIFPSVLIAN